MSRFTLASIVGAEMSSEEIVKRILSSCPGVSRESVLERLEEEKHRAGGLISDETLLRLIAARFGCEVANGGGAARALQLRDLVPGLSDVSAVGRVVAVFPPRAFGGSRKGRFASVMLADESGVLRVVLWNDKAGLIESGEVRVGGVVRFRRAYTREDLGGKVEVHAGEKCVVAVDPADVRSEDFPSISRYTTSITQLSRVGGKGRVNVAGVVQWVGSVSRFERADSSSGKVVRFTLSDGTGEVSVVVWNEKVDEVESLLKNETGVQLVNAKVKKASGGQSEVHVDGSTYVGAQDFSGSRPLASLREGMNRINVMGEVASEPVVREVKTARYGVLKVATLELRDETGRMWLSAWREHVDDVKDLKVGDSVVIEDAYVRRGFGDEPELSTRSSTHIVKKSVGAG